MEKKKLSRTERRERNQKIRAIREATDITYEEIGGFFSLTRQQVCNICKREKVSV